MGRVGPIRLNSLPVVLLQRIIYNTKSKPCITQWSVGTPIGGFLIIFRFLLLEGPYFETRHASQDLEGTEKRKRKPTWERRQTLTYHHSCGCFWNRLGTPRSWGFFWVGPKGSALATLNAKILPCPCSTSPRRFQFWPFQRFLRKSRIGRTMVAKLCQPVVIRTRIQHAFVFRACA